MTSGATLGSSKDLPPFQPVILRQTMRHGDKHLQRFPMGEEASKQHERDMVWADVDSLASALDCFRICGFRFHDCLKPSLSTPTVCSSMQEPERAMENNDDFADLLIGARAIADYHRRELSPDCLQAQQEAIPGWKVGASGTAPRQDPCPPWSKMEARDGPRSHERASPGPSP